jgi:hypothetical protein
MDRLYVLVVKCYIIYELYRERDRIYVDVKH